MSDEIKPGDLVMIVKGNPCCGKSKFMGMVATVIAGNTTEKLYCVQCGESNDSGDSVKLSLIDRGMNVGAQKYRLKKIDPPHEGDSLPTRADKEITA